MALLLLRKLGHDVVLVETGRAAVERVAQEPFDLVLMDLQMPEMDGLEATAVIRDRERLTGAHLPIVAMTAHAMKGDAKRCLDAGMDAYIAKPIRPDELAAVVERAARLGRSAVTGTAAAVSLSLNPG